MKLTNSTLFVAVAIAALAACGAGNRSPSDTLKDAIATLCERAHACRDSYKPEMNGGALFEDVYSTRVDQCVSRAESLLITLRGPDYFDSFDVSADAGRIKYSSDNADICLSALRGQTCDELFEQNGKTFAEPEACDLVFVGAVPTGGSCTLDADCATEGDDCLPTKVCG